MEGGRKRKERVFMGGLYLTPNPTTLGREGAVGRESDEGEWVICRSFQDDYRIRVLFLSR